MPGLLDPIEIGSFKLRNRIVMPPMATGLATGIGEVTDRMVAHYVDRSNDLGLLIMEHSYVSLEGRLSLNQPGIHSDSLISGLERLVEAVHAETTPIAVQINHAGGITSRGICGVQPLAPASIMIHGKSSETPREMTVNEIESMVEDFKRAAGRAVDAGFDAVEIHGSHGFLLNQFLSPLTNRRTDEFGGSLENRVRISLMIIEGIREVIEQDYPLLYRLGAEDMLPGGLTLEDGLKAAKMMASMGVDIIDVSGGLIGSRPSTLSGTGFFVPQAEAVKKAVGVPVIGVGGIKTAEEADRIIKSGKVDLVAVGRALLQDPKWATRAVNTLQNHS
jgi:2,4-dienoyl-CoA reductase-like NADH-dependent reductase (Old Yellow Enzyme family)